MAYTKQTFTAGQTLKASDLNTMSQGIYEGTNKSISILFVGNSLTQDAIAYLPYMLKNYYPEINFHIYMWYNGGYTLEMQYDNFTSNGKAQMFSVAENTGTWTTQSSSVTMSQVLANYKFDIVCMQEYFNYKTEYESVTDWNNCRDYIVSNYKGGNALEFVSLFHAPKRTVVEEVLAMTKHGNALILNETISQDMIPCGLAVRMAMDTDLDTLGDKQHLSVDDTHTQEGLPCLLQTYVVMCWLFDRLSMNKSIYGCSMRMTSSIYSTINTPGANLGSGVITGTDAQNLLAQEVAIKAYKAGKQFVMKHMYPSDATYTFSVVANPSDAVIKLNGAERSSITVLSGSTVDWEVSKEGYFTQRGSEIVVANIEKVITLNSALDIEDEDAIAYINATGITDNEVIGKVDTLVTALKTAGLWDKIDALYPCMGTTFEQMSYNLKDVNAYKLSATHAPTVVQNVGFSSAMPVTSAYNDSRRGTDFHLLGASGTAMSASDSKMISVGPSSGYGMVSSSDQSTNKGVLGIYRSDKAYVRTGGGNYWANSKGVSDYGLFMASLSSGIVYNGADLGATRNGNVSLDMYPEDFIHNGYRGEKDAFQGNCQVRLSGFGAGLTIAEMQTYSRILNEFKGIYTA